MSPYFCESGMAPPRVKLECNRCPTLGDIVGEPGLGPTGGDKAAQLQLLEEGKAPLDWRPSWTKWLIWTEWLSWTKQKEVIASLAMKFDYRSGKGQARKDKEVWPEVGAVRAAQAQLTAMARSFGLRRQVFLSAGLGTGHTDHNGKGIILRRPKHLLWARHRPSCPQQHMNLASGALMSYCGRRKGLLAALPISMPLQTCLTLRGV